ncbi:MAG TPA: hypothetical protein VLK25_08245 [Allosphingosinicella sp.]|nr:hypothetical protein [Allosphingosinicella sp.]
MPRRDPELPEGTDKVIAAASAAIAARREDSAAEGLVTQVRDQVSTLRGQAGDKLRTYADDGKGRASGLLDEFGGVLGDAARSVDERLGEDYGRYAHKAADAVSNFAGKVRDKSVDDIMGDAKDFVRKSPMVAIGIAAVAGFALMRVLKTGVEDARILGRERLRASNDDSGA